LGGGEDGRYKGGHKNWRMGKSKNKRAEGPKKTLERGGHTRRNMVSERHVGAQDLTNQRGCME